MTDFIYNPVKENDLHVVVSFLMGEGSLEGVWYGEQPEGERAKYWWRKHLSAALSENAEVKPDWSGAADWVRNNYQNYPNIASLCEAMEEAASGASVTSTFPTDWKNAMPGGKYTDEWESTRVADYNRGWNDYRKEAHKKLNAMTAPTTQKAPAATNDCERSHPHEAMSAECQVRAVIAEMRSKEARGAEATEHKLGEMADQLTQALESHTTQAAPSLLPRDGRSMPAMPYLHSPRC